MNMKIYIDTINKNIKIEETVSLSDFFDVLERLLPDSAWKEFKLEHPTQVIWNPQIIPCAPIQPYYYKPFEVYCGAPIGCNVFGVANGSIASGATIVNATP